MWGVQQGAFPAGPQLSAASRAQAGQRASEQGLEARGPWLRGQAHPCSALRAARRVPPREARMLHLEARGARGGPAKNKETSRPGLRGIHEEHGGLLGRRADAVPAPTPTATFPGPLSVTPALATCLTLPDGWFFLSSCINRFKNNTPTPAPICFKPQPAAEGGSETWLGVGALGPAV